MYSIFIDGSFFPHDGRAGFAVTIELNGIIKSAFAGSLPNVPDCYAAEIGALIKALEHDRFRETTLIHSDCLTLVGQVNSFLCGNEVKVIAIHDQLWQRLQDLLRRQPNVKIIWVPGHSGINQNHSCNERAKHAAYN